MKKILCLCLIGLSSLFIYGCYDTGSGYGKLEGIIFYNMEYDELESRIVDYFRNSNFFRKNNSLVVTNNYQNINSPAPTQNYYCVQAKSTDNIYVCFQIYENKDYQFSSLTINTKTINRKDCAKEEKKDERLYVYYLYENINVDDCLFGISKIHFEKEVDGKVYTYEGSRLISDHTYVSGFYFILDSEEKEATGNHA